MDANLTNTKLLIKITCEHFKNWRQRTKIKAAALFLFITNLCL